MKSTTEPTFLPIISYYNSYALSSLNFLDPTFSNIPKKQKFSSYIFLIRRKFSNLKKQRSCPEFSALTRPSRWEEKRLEGMKERRQVAAQVCRTFQLVAGLFFAIAADAAVHYC